MVRDGGRGVRRVALFFTLPVAGAHGVVFRSCRRPAFKGLRFCGRFVARYGAGIFPRSELRDRFRRRLFPVRACRPPR